MKLSAMRGSSQGDGREALGGLVLTFSSVSLEYVQQVIDYFIEFDKYLTQDRNEYSIRVL